MSVRSTSSGHLLCLATGLLMHPDVSRTAACVAVHDRVADTLACSPERQVLNVDHAGCVLFEHIDSQLLILRIMGMVSSMQVGCKHATTQKASGLSAGMRTVLSTCDQACTPVSGVRGLRRG